MKTLLRLIALSFLAGGLLRLFGNRAVFELFSIGHLWPDQPYALYIYRCLAGFVIFAGIILFVVSSAPERYRKLIFACAASFGLLGFIMLATGYMVGLSLDHYAADFLYCFLVSIVLLAVGRKACEEGPP